jgi:hypothetical protein
MGVYLLLPQLELSGDAQHYLATIRWDLPGRFHPHHLLFNLPLDAALNLAWALGFNPTVPLWGQVFAASYAGLFLWKLDRCLGTMGILQDQRRWIVLAVGSCYVVGRFAVDYETYLLPMVPSLWGTSLWLLQLRTSTLRASHIALAGVALGLACLVHQLMLWWALGLAYGWWRMGGLRAVAVYATAGLGMVLAGYVSVFSFVLGNPMTISGLWQFLTSAYQTGSASPWPEWYLVALMPLQLVRSLWAVDGQLPAVFGAEPLWAVLGAIGGLGGAVWAAWRWYRPGRPGYQSPPHRSILLRTLGLITALHLAFAIWSSANSEFLVPVFTGLGLLAALGYSRWQRALPGLGFSLLAWNIGTAYLPRAYHAHSPTPALVRWVEQHPQHSLWLDPYLVFRVSNQTLLQQGQEPQLLREIGKHIPPSQPVLTGCLSCYPQPVQTRADLQFGTLRETFCRQTRHWPPSVTDTLEGPFGQPIFLSRWDAQPR